MTENVRMLTVAQAADQLGVHPETIRRAIRRKAGDRKRLEAFQDDLALGAPWRITQTDLDAFKLRRGRR